MAGQTLPPATSLVQHGNAPATAGAASLSFFEKVRPHRPPVVTRGGGDLGELALITAMAGREPDLLGLASFLLLPPILAFVAMSTI